MSSTADDDSAHAIDPSVKHDHANREEALAPKRSPRLPLSGIRAARLREYALMTHSSSPDDSCNSR